ncbi:nuclease-related domain-containing protein [Shewanella litorisediminis]|uniref:NERD domain-containing protein n=1 Tax=Shewanella litorisediminis TaxID=1173586 RepID=A0ABX7G4M7_9GAMM|nr:NERD domain-containing protein [Shewanella litorisediminis]MCL2920227.1 NERD domain-containing protein [Shewanella litorisediminis]QRH02123.1 NERD domain-containing protein [Shewanella litorisediminis]
MDFIALFSGAFAEVWYIVPLLVVALIFKSRWFKGVFGEFLVNRQLVKLCQPSREVDSDYTLVKDVTLPTEDGTTQVDHILVSRFGVFVIETKNMKGWIFGSENQRQWTQKIYRHSSKFQNPLHQNYKHIKTLESLLGIGLEKLHSVIVFTGDSTFKTEMPHNVTYARGCLRYIKTFDKVVFSDTEYREIIEQIHEVKLKRGILTDLKHRQHIKSLIASKSLVKLCVRCGSEMVIRETKRGDNKGKQFWGCSAYPKCRSIEELS